MEYKSLQFGHAIRTYLISVPINKLRVVVDVVEAMVSTGHVPTRIMALIKDLMANRCEFRGRVVKEVKDMVKTNNDRDYSSILFHNKGWI